MDISQKPQKPVMPELMPAHCAYRHPRIQGLIVAHQLISFWRRASLNRVLMEKTAELILDGKTCKLPVVEGAEKERAVDISTLRDDTGYITLDDGYANTGSCQ